jgi:hypothetical protein
MSTMSVSTFLKVASKLPASTSIMLRGNHGIGKSQLGRQLAAMLAASEKIDDFEVIDRRLSQVSEGDIIGLPSTDGNVTRFNPPDWYKRACTKACFLFLDELNRATPEVMQAAFQIVLDRELNGWKLHPQTRVMTAINASAAYNVNEVDPALLDRFWVTDLFPDENDFLTWARKENDGKAHGYNCLPLVSDFISHEHKAWLDPPKNCDPSQKQVSRRSWERLGDAIQSAGVADDPNSDIFYPICLGYIGTEATIKFVEFAKTQNNRFTGADILERYSEVRHKVISKKRAELLNTAIEKASDYVQKLDKINEKQGKNLAAFMEDLPGELRISLWSKMTRDGIDKLDLVKSIHVYLAKSVLDVFGVPMGEAGIGIVPNIPGMFTDKDKKK